MKSVPLNQDLDEVGRLVDDHLLNKEVRVKDRLMGNARNDEKLLVSRSALETEGKNSVAGVTRRDKDRDTRTGHARKSSSLHNFETDAGSTAK